MSATGFAIILGVVLGTMAIVIGVSLWRSYRYDRNRTALANALCDRSRGSPAEWDVHEVEPPIARDCVVPRSETEK